MTAPLVMWVIYNRPSDFPEGLIARKWLVTDTGQSPQFETVEFVAHPPGGMTSEEIFSYELQNIRTILREREPALSVCLPRLAQDDPVVIETWM